MAGALEELLSPHKVKLLCNYGGRVLSSPKDGKLRYIGGESRIIAVNRDITYSELLLRVLELHGQTVTLKYQLPDEDLDALVSICSDEDIENLMDEYDEKGGGSRIKVFLFSSAEHYIDHLSDSSGDLRSFNRPIEAVKRSESGASDRMRDLDDLMGLYSDDTQSSSSLEEAVPSAPQLLDGVSLMERHSQLSFAPPSSQKHTQFTSFQNISSSSSSTATTEAGVRFPEEHVGTTSRVQFPLAGLASGFGHSASLDSPKRFESATEDHSVQQSAQQSFFSSSVETKHENRTTTLHELHSYRTSSSTIGSPNKQPQDLVAEQQSLVNLETYDFKKINPSNLLVTNGCADAQQELFMASHMAQFAEYLGSHSDVRFKDLESQHEKDLRTGFTMNMQTCSTAVSGLPLDRGNSVHLSEIQSISLHPLVDVLDQGHDGSEPLNETPQTSQPNLSIVDQHPLQQELNSRQQLSANGGNLLLETVGDFDTHRKYSAFNPVQLEAASEHEPQQIEEGRHLSLHGTEVFHDQQCKVHHLNAHPTCEVKPLMEQGPSLSLRKMKQNDLLDLQLQQERNGRDDLSMPVLTNSGLVQLNYLDLELNQTLEAFHQIRATSVDHSDGDRQLKSTSLEAQPIKAQIEQFENYLHLEKNDFDPEKPHLDPEKCPLQPRMIQLNKIDAMSNYDILSFSRTPNKVGPMERLESFHSDLTGSACSVLDKHCNKTQTADVAQEIQAAAENLAGVGAISHLPSRFPGNESHKEEDLLTQKTVKEGARLRNPNSSESLLQASDQGLCSEQILETATMASLLSPFSSNQGVTSPASRDAEITSRTDILQPYLCASSSSATTTPSINTSPLIYISGVANKVDASPSDGKNSQEWTHDGETAAMSEPQETCEISACEQIKGREDTEQQLNALINQDVQEEVLLEDYTVNAEGSKEMIFEDSTSTSMDIKSEEMRKSICSVASSEAEFEAINRGLQIIINDDLEERRELGSGTFGTVYYGKWRGCDVAIKRIKSSCFSGSFSEQERLKADFWTEACILGQLHHPNVVAFYGVVPDCPDGTLATVTEFMVNGSLKQVLQNKSDRILFFRRRLFIALDSAFGMEYLHSKNIIHFDLKCENLLVNMRDAHRPICKVGDFGLSKVKQRTLVSGGVRGTLPWMAPELLNGNSSMVSEKVDVFSFGIVMWELLTGEEPYADLHYGAILGGILSDTLRPPVPKGCDPSWRLLMESCWSADPAERPSFAEIASALRLMAASQPVKVQQHDQL